jgi:two-component system, cell cycle response regulator
MPKQKTGGNRILIVDDEAGIRKAYFRSLTRKKYTCQIAASAAEARDLLKKEKVDLILCDIMMPEENGIDFISGVRKNYPYIAVVMMTGLDDLATAEKAFELGVHGYLLKPFSDMQLVISVDRALRIVALEKKQLSYTKDLKRNLRELRKANRKILEQQKMMVEQERLKVLLQMAGATAHELNQPLMTLLGNIELLQMDGLGSAGAEARLQKIEASTLRLAEIVRKIQSIRHDQTIPYCGDSDIIDLNQPLKILLLEGIKTDDSLVEKCLAQVAAIKTEKVRTIAAAVKKIEAEPFDVTLMGNELTDGDIDTLLKKIRQHQPKMPVIAITDQNDTESAGRLSDAGVSDSLSRDLVDKDILSRIIAGCLEKKRIERELAQLKEKTA